VVVISKIGLTASVVIQMVVEEQVVSHMGTDIVVNVVDQPVIMVVNRREGTLRKYQSLPRYQGYLD